MASPIESAARPATEALSAPALPDYAHYTDEAFVHELLADMRRPSPLHTLAPSGIFRLRYRLEDLDLRPFVVQQLIAAGHLDAAEAERAQLATRLEDLHEFVPKTAWSMDSSQQCAAGRALYTMPNGFEAAYRQVVQTTVAALPQEGPFHLQTTPNFRVFFPRADGYPGKPSFHNDIMLGHSPREWNVFVPLTPCADSRSLWIAELSDSLDLLQHYGADFRRFGHDTQLSIEVTAQCERICAPLQAEVGEILVFDSRCLHAGPPNTTDHTRVTLDTRLLSARDLESQHNDYRGLGRRRAHFTAGAYFSSDTVG